MKTPHSPQTSNQKKVHSQVRVAVSPATAAEADLFPLAGTSTSGRRAPGPRLPSVTQIASTSLEELSDKRFRIETHDDGQKIAVLRVFPSGSGWGHNATASFMYDYRPLLEAEINAARGMSLQQQRQDVILAHCPTLRWLGKPTRISDILCGAFKTARDAAIDILWDLFPECSRDYVERKTRKSTAFYQRKSDRVYTYQQKMNRVKKP